MASSVSPAAQSSSPVAFYELNEICMRPAAGSRFNHDSQIGNARLMRVRLRVIYRALTPASG